MAKRKSQSSKLQKKKGATAPRKVKKLSKRARSKAMAKPLAKAKPKRAALKKNAPPAPAVDAVAVDLIEQPMPAQQLCGKLEGDRGISREL
jgi:hypothetical protein